MLNSPSNLTNRLAETMRTNIIYRGVVILCFLLLGMTHSGLSMQQDTTRLSVNEFINLALERAPLMNVRQQDVNLAQNRLDQARAQRILPRIELTTAHGLVPGVVSSNPELYSDRMLYLDPNLDNDWENWGIFTRAEVSAIQPVYTWGAIRNALQAAQAGVQVAQAGFEAEKAEYTLQLYELYYSMLLVVELERLIENAGEDLATAERELENMLEEGNTDIQESDMFELQIFKFEFQTQVDEVAESKRFLTGAWNLALGVHNEDSTMYLPAEEFLDPLEYRISDLSYYEQTALANRPELRQVENTRLAAQYGLEIARAANYPTVIMAFSAALARTPNRPRQANPFIRNSTNYENVVYGIGLRQNLNFRVNRENINRSAYQLRQANYALDAVSQGILLEIREQYRSMMMSFSRLTNTKEALNVSNEWLRMEQIDYDLGFGDVEKLIDAVKSTLELEVELRQRIYDFNVTVGKLNKASGLPVMPVVN